MNRSAASPDLDELVSLFYADPAALGRLEQATPDDLPPAYVQLLAHHHHMTVTVEAFHQSLVDVRVLKTLTTGTHYARKILLARQRDGVIVQFGIMRVNLSYLDAAVQSEILAQQTPLGRILIEHNVLREIQLSSLWRVAAGPDLAALLGMGAGGITFGRTAMINCNGEPAIELLEIVAPV